MNCVIMGRSKKKTKSGQNSAGHVNMDSQLQGIVNPITPPTGQYSGQPGSDMNMMPSSLISQTNEVLYGQNINLGAHMLSQASTFPVQPNFNEGFPQSRAQLYNEQNVNNNAVTSCANGNMRQAVPQQQTQVQLQSQFPDATKNILPSNPTQDPKYSVTIYKYITKTR